MKKLLEDMNKINSCEDLQERNLTLSDFKQLQTIVEELKKDGKSAFFQTSIARYLVLQDIDIELGRIHFLAKIKEKK